MSGPGRFRRLAPRAALAAAFALAVVLRVVHFGVPARSPDEELYARFGAGIAREGLAWQVRIVRDFNRGEDVDYPWQHRVGYTALVALAMRASGDTTVRAGELLSTASGLAAIAVTGALAWEMLGAWPACAAVTFLAVSPLDLALARRAWQDDVVMLLAALLLAAFVRAATGGGRRWTLAFLALASYGMIVKESLAIPAGFGTLALVALAWERTRRPRDAALVLAAGAAALLVSVAAVVAASGGWAELRTTLALSREANAPDQYLREYQTGGVLDYYVRGLLKLQPFPWLLGYAFAALALARPRALAAAFPDARSRRALVATAGHLALFSAVAFSYASKNMRFLSPVYPAVALLAAAGLRAARAWAAGRGRRAGALAAAALTVVVLVSAVRDVRCFRHYFVEDEVQDLATPWFTQVDAQDRAERAREDAGP